jgi:uncharacterized delta-60 repeat protein
MPILSPTARRPDDERILVAGLSLDTLGQLTASVWRFTSGGLPDGTFAGTGGVVTSFHGQVDDYFEDGFQDLAIDSSNRIVAVGSAGHFPPDAPGVTQVALARYDASGNLDSTFGNGGTVVVAPGPAYAVGAAAAIQADGRTVVAGYSHNHDPSGLDIDKDVGVWGFDADGGIDATFGIVGSMADPIIASGRAGCFGMALRGDGKIVCGGYAADASFTYAVVARFWQ